VSEIRVLRRVFGPKRKGPRGRYSRRWEDNIRMDLREIEWEAMDWMHMAQDRDQWRLL
jgi:hypothetical protein